MVERDVVARDRSSRIEFGIRSTTHKPGSIGGRLLFRFSSYIISYQSGRLVNWRRPFLPRLRRLNNADVLEFGLERKPALCNGLNFQVL